MVVAILAPRWTVLLTLRHTAHHHPSPDRYRRETVSLFDLAASVKAMETAVDKKLADGIKAMDTVKDTLTKVCQGVALRTLAWIRLPACHATHAARASLRLSHTRPRAVACCARKNKPSCMPV